MNLVPTLEKWCVDAVGGDFWANHEANQRILDDQCERDEFYHAGVHIVCDPITETRIIPSWSDK